MKKPTSTQTLAGLVAVTLLTSTILSPTRAVSLPRSYPNAKPAAMVSNVPRIAFASDRDGNLEIYSMAADGGDLTRITENTAEDFSPGWSPDGSRLAFVSNRDGNHEIYVMNADGTGQTRLTNNTADDLSPAWSPDGTRIAFSSRRDGNDEIYVMNPDGSSQLNLTNDVGDDAQPSFSPDATMITFASNREFSQYEIYRMTADGMTVVRLTNNDANDSNPNWSALGNITFQTDRDGDEEIYSINASDGSGQINLSVNPEFDIDPFRTSDGTRIVFASSRLGGDFEVFLANADGSSPTRLTNNPGNDIQPAFQTQGTIPAPSASTVQFSATDYSQNEVGIFAAITVTRVGSTTGAATVDFAARNGTATDRSDYAPSVGTLRFNPGETSKIFIVSIIDDAFIEANESINLTLRNVMGATLGLPATATLTIVDNDSAILSTNPNPIDFAPFFVRGHYLDFLGREPDQAGFDFWTDNITKCKDPSRRPPGQTVDQCVDRQRETTSGAFFLSTEFQYTGYFVYRFYKGALNRQPKFSEFTADAQFVGAGIIDSNGQLSATQIETNKALFAEQFVNCMDVTKPRCAEFRAIYDNLNNQQYVDRLFMTTGINASTADRTALVNGLNGGIETRASVAQKIVDGTRVISAGEQQFLTPYGRDFYLKEFNAAFVLMEYLGYLRRDPDEAGYQHWKGKLDFYSTQRAGNYGTYLTAEAGEYITAEMVRAFIISHEYRQRFGPP